MTGSLTRRSTAQLPDSVADAIEARLAKAAEERVAERIFARDDTLWGPAGQPEVADRLGWLDAHDRLAPNAAQLLAAAAQAYIDGLRHVVVLGMGGSSLAPEVFRRSFPAAAESLTLHVLDSTDAQAVRDIEAAIILDETLFIASSKSGGTIETLSALEHFWVATGGNGQQFCAITDPGSGLEQLANEREFRNVFSGDPEIGGRYSALSPFGIVPAAFAGYDIAALLAGGTAVSEACRAGDPQANPGVHLGCVLGELALAGRDKLTFIIDEPISSFGLWVEQLTAESLGKHGKGILPVAGEPIGAADAYGGDRVIVAIDGPGGEHSDGVRALAERGLPVITMAVESAADLGSLMVLWEFAVAVAGWVLELNPFDQPNVQSAKDKTNEVLAGDPPAIEPAGAEAVTALLAAGPPSYLAIQAYTAPNDELDAAIAGLRAAIRDRTQMATTFGYGPRYLHSTGQLHKGGPPTGRFLQLISDSQPDIAVGGAAGTFETLKRAQADGDLLVLRGQGLPAERVTLGPDPVATVQQLRGQL
jgi:glucose-6-phosphate isomerase